MYATIEKGRWSSVKTAHIYLEESIAVYNSLSIPEQRLAYFDQLGHAMLASLFVQSASGAPSNLIGTSILLKFQRTAQPASGRVGSRIVSGKEK